MAVKRIIKENIKSVSEFTGLLRDSNGNEFLLCNFPCLWLEQYE